MLYRILGVVVLGLGFFTSAVAETQKINNVNYGVVVNEDQEIEMTNGVIVTTGGLSHATSVNVDGDINVQWCRQTVATKDGEPIGGGGYCTIVNQESSDMLWVWFGQSEWGVIGGTGAWAGATGGGITEQVSQNADGRSFISKAMGEVMLK